MQYLKNTRLWLWARAIAIFITKMFDLRTQQDYCIILAVLVALIFSPKQQNNTAMSLMPTVHVKTSVFDPADGPLSKEVEVLEPAVPVSYEEVVVPKPVAQIRQLRFAKDFRSDRVRSVQHLDKSALRDQMEIEGFRNLSGYDRNHLRRIYAAYHYDMLLWDTRAQTGLSLGFLFAYFIIESTRQGVETDLFAVHLNPGAVKFRGSYRAVQFNDDCTDSSGKSIPCDFVATDNYADMITMWSNVFLHSRYDRCRSKVTVEAICKCFRDVGYHSSRRYMNRVAIAKDYWQYRQSFPNI